MKKTIVTFLLMLSAMFILNDSQVVASQNNDIEAYAEPTDITTFIDEIEVQMPEALTGSVETVDETTTEDYRAWTQDDSRWGTIALGNSGKTVKQSGCLVTSITKLIIQAGLKSEKDFTPATLVTWLNKNGGFTDGGGLYWAKPADYVSGLSYHGNILEQKIDGYNSSSYNDKFVDLISSGYHLVVQVKSGGHWVAIDEKKTLETGVIYIMDSLPANVNADLTLAERYPTFDRVEAYKGGKTPEVETGDPNCEHTYKRTVAKKATTEETGKLKDTCTICGHIKYVTISRIDTMKTPYKMYTYNGKVRTPKVTVTNKMGNQINSKYYTVTYDEGRKQVGKYTITVEFKERYTGTYTLTFSIIPAKTEILQLTGKKKAFNIKWEKVTEQVGWYEIRYSTSSDFSKNAETKRVRQKYSSSTVRDLKANTTYYVKMRTYKKVDGVRFYSGWTSVEEVTTD